MKPETFDFYDRTSLKSYNLDKTMQDQLNALSQLDVFTRKHCENVAAITCRLCEYLHCSKGFTEYCTICAYLHDLGKLFIPPGILQKPAQLTDEEYEVIKTHTKIGYEMCIKDERLRPYAAGPLYHHEALNGSGYPQGLTKKDIPYEGQIIRVADEYDAIVSKRQYKSHVGITDTIKILIENSHPNPNNIQSNAINKLVESSKMGKNNPIIVKTLIKVVIDDINYEIFCTQEYVENLKENIKRLEKAEKYYYKMKSSKDESKEQYFYEYTKLYLEKGEDINSFLTIKQEYEDAYEKRKAKIDSLYEEIKNIKKLKV
ncbi:MAG: HD domain-containing protein [Clostridia bacterium]|nr:HD domain-containing protein [Clostridia bacterium]